LAADVAPPSELKLFGGETAFPPLFFRSRRSIYEELIFITKNSLYALDHDILAVHEIRFEAEQINSRQLPAVPCDRLGGVGNRYCQHLPFPFSVSVMR
jgi:hypothetical protein